MGANPGHHHSDHSNHHILVVGSPITLEAAEEEDQQLGEDSHLVVVALHRAQTDQENVNSTHKWGLSKNGHYPLIQSLE